VAFGPPWFSRVWELGKSLLEVDTAWAWCLLSPLLGVSQIDSESKSLLQSMRKEYERPGLLSPYTDSYPLLLHPSAHREVAHVLAELLECNPELGVTSVEQASEGGAIAIGPHTGLGRKFGALAEGAGIADCLLFRTQSVPENIKVINEGGAPRVVVRTEVLQQLVHAEVGFLFGYALELAQPEHRLMASMLPEHRPHLLPALYHVLGWRERAGHRARFIAERICAVMDDARRERWKEMLEPLREQDPSALGGTWWAAVCIMARRAGLLAGPDLRQAFRVVARIDDDVPRPRVVAHLAELDEYVAQSAALQDLVAFAASPAFGQLMQGANPVAVS